VETYCEGFAWPQALGNVPLGPPEGWTSEARAALLGRFVRLWPCVRARVCAGTVNQAVAHHATDAAAPPATGLLHAATRSAGGTPFTPMTWPDVEAVGLVATVAACLRAGGAESRAAVDALFSILVTQNGGLAERLMVDSGLEAVVYASLVRAGVHRALCGLIEQPQRFDRSPLSVSPPSGRSGGVMRAYVSAKFGSSAARAGSPRGEWVEGDGFAGLLPAGDDASAALFDCMFLLHMCTNWRTGHGVLGAHCASALRTMDLTPDEALAAQLTRALDEHEHGAVADAALGRRRRGGRKKQRRSGARQREDGIAAAPPAAVENAYISMLVACLGVSLPQRAQRSNISADEHDTPASFMSPYMSSDTWRLRQRGVAELMSVAVRNGEFVRSLARDPFFIPTLVSMAAGPAITVRIQAQAACALYHVAGADVRSIMYSAVMDEGAAAPDNKTGEAGDDSGDDDEEQDEGATDVTAGSAQSSMPSSITPRASSRGGSATDEVDLDDVFGGRVGPESAAFLLGVFDSQWHARRSDPALVRARLEAALNGGASRTTASLLMAAGAERALVALVRDRTGATAHARTARGYAAAALTVLSRIDECRPALVSAGAVAPLVAMLEETNCALDFGAYAKDVLLAAALPHDPAPMSFDGVWVLQPGKPLLAEIAAAALLGLTGRACLFTGASAPWDGAPSFAEAMLRGVTAQFGSFGAPEGGDSGGEESLARATGARRRAHARLLNVLTIDYETANLIVDEGAIPPLVALLNRGSELAKHALAALAVSPDICHRIAEAGGESALRTTHGPELDG
jgi:hypothetical protein